MTFDAEARAERWGEQTAACGGADKGERRQVELNASRAGTFVYHDVNAEILHCGVEIFFDNGAEAVYLVDKQHVVFLERCQDAGKVAGLVEHGT